MFVGYNVPIVPQGGRSRDAYREAPRHGGQIGPNAQIEANKRWLIPDEPRAASDVST